MRAIARLDIRVVKSTPGSSIVDESVHIAALVSFSPIAPKPHVPPRGVAP